MLQHCLVFDNKTTTSSHHLPSWLIDSYLAAPTNQPNQTRQLKKTVFSRLETNQARQPTSQQKPLIDLCNLLAIFDIDTYMFLGSNSLSFL